MIAELVPLQLLFISPFQNVAR